MSCWVIERPDGAHEYLRAEPTVRDGDVVRVAQAPRWPAPDGTEDWDFEGACFVTNEARSLAWIDRQHGPERIAIAHATKAIEARLILSGAAIDGLVAAEAAATGQDVAELAAAIVANADADAAAEVERITNKRIVRNG